MYLYLYLFYLYMYVSIYLSIFISLSKPIYLSIHVQPLVYCTQFYMEDHFCIGDKR